MTQRIKILSAAPYYDDYDPAKDYLQVLFRPGFPVQARELTTLQTFLREQVSRFGDKILNSGSVIEGGDLEISNNITRLVLTGANNVSFPASGVDNNFNIGTIGQLEGLILSNSSGTAKAKVLAQPTASDKTKSIGNLYVQYITEEKFTSTGDYIYAKTDDNPTLTTPYYTTFSSYNAATLGKIKEGMVYVKGAFVKIAEQTVLISATTSSPSVHLGYTADEDIVTPSDDTTIYDNSRGSVNEGAPGAHRLKIKLTFATKSLESAPDPTFFRLATIKNGVREESNYVSQEYGDLIDIMARRTHDESGNYALRPFTPTLYNGTDDYFKLAVGPSKAYVKGYEIDKRTPTYLNIQRGLDTQRISNYKIPFVGTTSVVLSSVSNTLPGTTNATDPFNSTNRLQLKNGSGNIIGVARGYAVKRETTKGISQNKLYMYDVRMFQVVTTTSDISPVTGHFVQTQLNSGYVYTTDGSAGIAGNSFAVVNATGVFSVGKTITDTVNGNSSAITAVASFGLNDVTTIDGATGSFSGTVQTGTVQNANSKLYTSVGRHAATLKSGGAIIDNDYEVIEYTGSAASNILSNNGQWDTVRYDDQEENTKTLNFAYLKIRRSASRSSINYGWEATDKELSLFYPDGYRAYGVRQTSASTFATGRFDRLTISTSGVIPQGAVVTGATSGSKAIVALSNSGTTGATQLSNNVNYHQVETGTGSSDTLEVIFTKGQSFTANETLSVEVPPGSVAFTNTTTYLSAVVPQGDDITALYGFDNGQRNEFYDVSRLVRKKDAPAPSQDIIVFFSYFTVPNTNRHYYSVDSYSGLNFFGYDVRNYSGPRPIKPQTADEGEDLRNVLDFRFRVNTQNDIAVSPFNFNSRSFSSQAKILPNSKFTTDIDIYLGRKDRVTLNDKGIFVIEKGTPSLRPQKPAPSTEAMDLYYLTIPPAMRYISEIAIEILDNRRYTMRDIGKLDKRIDRLEEAVTLSLLESQALNDDISGRTRIGFITDDFSTLTSSLADRRHKEFNVSQNVLSKELHAAQTSGVKVPMELSTSTNINTTFFPGFAIKSFGEEIMVEQLSATTQAANATAAVINVTNTTNTTNTTVIEAQPEEQISYVGTLDITPDEDTWRVRVDEYFTDLYGELQPFDGTAEEWDNFQNITTASPGGRTETVTEWVGIENDPYEIDEYSQDGGRDAFGTGYNAGQDIAGYTQAPVKARVKTTTTTFDNPRPIAGTESTTTLDGSTVIDNPESYWVRPVSITFSATGLKPKTVYQLTINDKYLEGKTYTTDDEGSATGTFRIPANTFKAGTLSIQLLGKVVGDESYASTTFKSIGYVDTYHTIQPVSETKSVPAPAPTVTPVVVEPNVSVTPAISTAGGGGWGFTGWDHYLSQK